MPNVRLLMSGEQGFGPLFMRVGKFFPFEHDMESMRRDLHGGNLYRRIASLGSGVGCLITWDTYMSLHML